MAIMLAIRLSDVNAEAKIGDPLFSARDTLMSVLAVFVFSDASVAIRHRVLRWAADLLSAEAPAEVPSGRPRLLRDAGISPDIAVTAWRDAMMRDPVYRSHWLL